MSFPQCILLILTIILNVATSTMSTSQSSKTLSSLGRNNLLHKASNDDEVEYITFVDKPSVNKGSQVALINQLLPIATKLASMREYIIPDHIVQILNMIFEAFTSVLFGPHTDVYWPLFTNVLLVFMKLLM